MSVFGVAVLAAINLGINVRINVSSIACYLNKNQHPSHASDMSGNCDECNGPSGTPR